ncbi:hypothetical protein [Streptomyces sp. NPDC019224]|uniref:hypothetical protein n=1 Tax=Streptomyces sp. NPDC019224 TaxID=3154484 RepID=UPI0033CDB7D1
MAGSSSIWPDRPRATRLNWKDSTRVLLEYLLTFPGETWQERWDASPLGQGQIAADEVGSRRTTGIGSDPLASMSTLVSDARSSGLIRPNGHG